MASTDIKEATIRQIRDAYLSPKNVKNVYDAVRLVFTEHHGHTVPDAYKRVTADMMSNLFRQHHDKLPPEHLSNPKRAVVFFNALAMDKIIRLITSDIGNGAPQEIHCAQP
ncbi:hypothetical protein HDV00_012771 [Rhizophlyctis rosea]|nr:hypothetical protein HDV00_012771 [Rhizophlyctis rosea]